MRLPQDLGIEEKKGKPEGHGPRCPCTYTKRIIIKKKNFGSQSIDVAQLIVKQGIQKQMLHFKAVVSKETGYDLC